MINYRKYGFKHGFFAFTVAAVVIVSLFAFAISAAEPSSPSQDSVSFQSFIVELSEPSVVDKKVEIENGISELRRQAEKAKEDADGLSGHEKEVKLMEAEEAESNAYSLEQNSGKILHDHRGKIESEHSKALGSLQHFNVGNEYFAVFNGFSVDVSGDADDVEGYLKSSPYVKAVYPNLEVRVLLAESVPRVNADRVWQLLDETGSNITGRQVVISIIDTGIDYAHPDLGGCFGSGCRVVGGFDFVNNDADPMDDNGHGTHVAGIAAGNGILKGVAPEASLLALKAFSSAGSGNEANIIAAIERSVDPNSDGSFDDRADVISMSFGAICLRFLPAEPCGPDDPMSRAVDRAVDAGAVAVVAAGNAGGLPSAPFLNFISSPGTSRNAITVAATDKEDSIAFFSSSGLVWNGRTVFMKPDIAAPGFDICSACSAAFCGISILKCMDDKHIFLSGTSMATPHVSGAAALILQANPGMKPVDVKNILLSQSRELFLSLNSQGYGRLDALASVNEAVDEDGSAFLRLDRIDVFRETDGLVNNIIEAGDSVELPFVLVNGRAPVKDVKANLISFDTLLAEVKGGERGFGSFEPYEEKTEKFTVLFKRPGIVNLELQVSSPEFIRNIIFTIIVLPPGLVDQLPDTEAASETVIKAVAGLVDGSDFVGDLK